MSAAIDISTIPALVRLINEVETTKKPRKLKCKGWNEVVEVSLIVLTRAFFLLWLLKPISGNWSRKSTLSSTE
jgi:hypothetical protein